MIQFAVRKGRDGNSDFLEFLYSHREEDAPRLESVFQLYLPGFRGTRTWMPPDDLHWECTCDRGTFIIWDEWGELYLVPKSQHEKVLKAAIDALVTSGLFELIPG
ncbi:hypothetical protein [Dyella sp. 2HG41-7]|uniref:hypothetical protein n=1 Tax=Dyella sp. 2HG41-7 TaxID=2883239 RepID=UPI001F182503|nr:hypothetical protein [Dyella sp. 2HG41-7]